MLSFNIYNTLLKELNSCVLLAKWCSLAEITKKMSDTPYDWHSKNDHFPNRGDRKVFDNDEMRMIAKYKLKAAIECKPPKGKFLDIDVLLSQITKID